MNKQNNILIFYKTTLLLFVTVALISCTQTLKQEPNKAIENSSNNNTNWYDKLILKYINQTDNQLVRLAIKEKYTEDWILDRRENTESASYLIFHIGHDLTDQGNTNPRFTTDAWLYIDSLTSKIYEYDLPNDSLIEWKK